MQCYVLLHGQGYPDSQERVQLYCMNTECMQIQLNYSAEFKLLKN